MVVEVVSRGRPAAIIHRAVAAVSAPGLWDAAVWSSKGCAPPAVRSPVFSAVGRDMGMRPRKAHVPQAGMAMKGRLALQQVPVAAQSQRYPFHAVAN
eukprot:CAMPEP_0174360340 /NCGR_PEP_ID=MMETSP0811_2-20130205/53610_1 /TAXON_ID=73025 ORGANISM="Eutreptiella gymnastica-like, Strain CCMP1594" /NCGR_SAMPLE_ID=MMETSP0811_2 /ASSEMBLY_ACC=CAM_ASM_000667 /LENGTH=96 /DNA_ID=CAMNT_0015495961 /DNA_START=210 /DNA_END=499 /DNA_ORIENTATION=+